MPTRLSWALPSWLRALAILLLVALPLNAAELNNSGTGQWSESDSSNTSASPDGWPIGLAPNQVRGVGQSMMGAIKRFWDRINPTVTTTGSANAYVYTPTNASFPTAYVSGECYSFKANFANTGAATLAVNGLAAKNLFKQGASGPTALLGNEIQTNQMVTACYDGTQFQITSALANGSATLGAGLVLIQCQTASASATLDFTTGIGSTYDTYLLTISSIVPATNGANLWLRVSTSATFRTASYSFSSFASSGNATSGDAGSQVSDAKIILAVSLSNAGDRDARAQVWLSQPSNTARYKQITFDSSALTGSGQTRYFGSGDYNGDTGAVDGLRVMMSGGNITSGKACLYGIAVS